MKNWIIGALLGACIGVWIYLALMKQPTPAPVAPTASGDAPEAEPVSAEPAHSWAPIRTESALERKHTSLHEHVLFPFALLVPPLVWLGALLAAALRKRAAARAATNEGRALREAERHLQAAERAAHGSDAVAFHAAASAALLSVLEARLGEKVTGLTHAQLDSLLHARGLDAEPRKKLHEALKQSDLARFAGTGAQALEADLGTVQALYRSLVGFEPRAGAL